jgi:23S rRNA (adenine1618-N6)-methyltransferase
VHPRNRHARPHDFARLTAVSPDLRPFVRTAPHGGPSIDFADPQAVRALNRALLADAYGVHGWDVPPGYLCPPIPGRADYVHHVADLLAGDRRDGRVPRGAPVRILDVGTGASAIYALIGHREYGWSFVGSDVDAAALDWARGILAANAGLAGAVELRPQGHRAAVFTGVVRAGERFHASVCNPPFHASAAGARAAAETKWRKLGRGAARAQRNFGGQPTELWCPGGESGFVARMIEESRAFGVQVCWFTSLVSSSGSLPGIRRALARAAAKEIRTVPMAQGQKQSRFVAWTFLGRDERTGFGASR